MKLTSSGFLLAEALLAILILAMISGSIFFMISASNRTTINAYHQFLGEQTGQEILEVFRSIGFSRLSECHEEHIADYQLNKWQQVEVVSKETGIERPDACTLFERKITMQLLEKDGTPGILLRVAVRLTGNNFNEREIISSTLLVEQP